MTLRFANLQDTLYFLQESYETFRNMSVEDQAMCLEYNEEIRKTLDPEGLPLRVLYIDLAMYDQLIQQLLSKEQDNNNSQNYLLRLMSGKVATQHMIALREEAKESITPEACHRDEQKLYDCILQILDHKALKEEFQKLWEKNKKKEKRWENVVKFITRQHSSMYKQQNTLNTAHFRSLFFILECVLGLDLHGGQKL